MSLNNFSPLGKLGEGSFSTVIKVRRKKDGKIYAMKQVSVTQLSEKDQESSVNEVRLLASITHPNIIGYKEAFTDLSSKLFWCPPHSIVMEYADAGDLHQRIIEHQRQGLYMSEEFIWSVLVQMTQGLKALHELNIMHRDIKSANVFLFNDGCVKLGDFNVSKVAKEGMLKTQTGTPYYASPEVWKVHPYDQKSDIWSLGCVIYEAAALHPPFRAGDMEALHRRIVQGVAPPLPMQFSYDLQTLVTALLTVDPVRRPTCDVILRSPIVLRRLNSSKRSTNTMSDSVLLKTIKAPTDFKMLDEKLPKSRYCEEEEYSGSLQRLPRIPVQRSALSNVRSDSMSQVPVPTKLSGQSSHNRINLSMDSGNNRMLRESYGGHRNASRRQPRESPLSNHRDSKAANGNRILESYRKSRELQGLLKTGNSHPRHRLFLPTNEQ